MPQHLPGGGALDLHPEVDPLALGEDLRAPLQATVLDAAPEAGIEHA